MTVFLEGFFNLCSSSGHASNVCIEDLLFVPIPPLDGALLALLRQFFPVLVDRLLTCAKAERDAP